MFSWFVDGWEHVFWYQYLFCLQSDPAPLSRRTSYGWNGSIRSVFVFLPRKLYKLLGFFIILWLSKILQPYLLMLNCSMLALVLERLVQPHAFLATGTYLYCRWLIFDWYLVHKLRDVEVPYPTPTTWNFFQERPESHEESHLRFAQLHWGADCMSPHVSGIESGQWIVEWLSTSIEILVAEKREISRLITFLETSLLMKWDGHFILLCVSEKWCQALEPTVAPRIRDDIPFRWFQSLSKASFGRPFIICLQKTSISLLSFI